MDDQEKKALTEQLAGVEARLDSFIAAFEAFLRNPTQQSAWSRHLDAAKRKPRSGLPGQRI